MSFSEFQFTSEIMTDFIILSFYLIILFHNFDFLPIILTLIFYFTIIKYVRILIITKFVS